MTKKSVPASNDVALSKKIEAVTSTYLNAQQQRIQSMSDDQLADAMVVLLCKWNLQHDGARQRNEAPLKGVLARILDNFEIDGDTPTEYGFNDIYSYIKKDIAESTTIYHTMFSRGVFEHSTIAK